VEIEEIKPGPINKDISPRAVEQGGARKVVNPYIDRLNSRFRSSETGEIDSEQNIPGTISYNPALPAGTNTIIGSFVDRESGKVIFFNHNSNNDHGIYTWNPITNAFATLIQKTFLNFSSNPRYRITGAGVVGNLLYWTDGDQSLRAINMTRDYSAVTDEACINLYKRPPVKAPYLDFSGTVNYAYLTLNAAYKTSAIAGNIYQFATRYIYTDDEVSAFSQWSRPAPAYTFDSLSKFLFNGMTMTIYYQAELAPIISKVQVLYRKNNSASWYLYSEHAPAAFTGNSLTVTFYDDNASTVIPASESSKAYDSVPLKSKALATFKGRNFLVADSEGYTINANQDFSISKETFGGSFPLMLSLKEGGNYSYGPIYFDKDMRTPGVGVFENVYVEYQNGTVGNDGLDPATRVRAKVSFIDNNYPSWAKYVTIGRSKNQNYEQYMQISVKPMFYVGEGELKDAAGAAIAIPATEMEKYNNGKVYLKVLPDNVTLNKKFSHLHFQVPENIPFAPDSSYFVRFLATIGTVTKEFTTPVISFDGQVIITNNINNMDWSASAFDATSGTYTSIVIEVFKIKASAPKEIYELSDFMYELPMTVPFNPTNPDFDTFVSNSVPIFKFKNLKIQGNATDICYSLFNTSSPYTESPSAIFNSILLGSESTINKEYSNTSSNETRCPDYTRVPDYPGRLIAYNPNAKQLARTTTIRFSDPFIQDSKINGLSSFAALNEYALPTHKTAIKKLQPAGNVLLAIHERVTTSLYVGEGFIKDATGADILTKTDNVIGGDRELDGEFGTFGTYHPESVAEWNGIVFGFDIFKGAIWRYNNNGQVPVSNLGMQTYFKAKADQYLPYKDTVAIIGGIDPYHKEYIITFPAISGVDPETWRFDFKNNEWVGRIDYYPDAYAHINNMLISFKSGLLWVHNVDKTNYNKFYGVKYSRKVTVSVNPFPSRVKNYAALQVSSEELTEGDRFPVTNYANLAAFPGVGSANTRYRALDTGLEYYWNGASYTNMFEVSVITASNKEGQATYMKRKEFDKSQGIFYGPILKDTNTPDSLMLAGQLKLRDGKDMLSQALEITLENNSTGPARHHFFNVAYVHSKLSI
jgi:hypothetical protein